MKSALPWSIELIDHRKRKTITIVAARGVVCQVGTTDMPGASEDAAAIVQAVNAHPALVEACKAELEVYDGMDMSTLMPKTLARIAALRAALAQAGVE